MCEYLFIKTGTALLFPHYALLVRTPIVIPRPASSFLNISTISVRCSMAVFCFSRRRSPTMQRIHRIYGGAPAISCASASHAPKRYTTSPALWRAQGSLDLRSTFALADSHHLIPFGMFPVSSDGIIKQKHNTKKFPYMRSVVRFPTCSRQVGINYDNTSDRTSFFGATWRPHLLSRGRDVHVPGHYLAGGDACAPGQRLRTRGDGELAIGKQTLVLKSLILAPC